MAINKSTRRINCIHHQLHPQSKYDRLICKIEINSVNFKCHEVLVIRRIKFRLDLSEPLLLN